MTSQILDSSASTTRERGQSVFPELEALLPLIAKPIQYVGGELNAVTKPWSDATVHWALMYPDAYEVGAPNQGVQILYEVLNEQADVLAERTYAVWPDLESLMREHEVQHLPLTRTAVSQTLTYLVFPSVPSSATPTC